MSKKFKILALLAAVFAFAGIAWAAAGITSSTNPAAWLTSSGTDSITPSNGSDAVGFSVGTDAGDFTFVAGNGLQFQSNGAVPPTNSLATGTAPSAAGTTKSGFNRWIYNLAAAPVTSVTNPAGNLRFVVVSDYNNTIGVSGGGVTPTAEWFPLPARVTVPAGQTITTDVRTAATSPVVLGTNIFIPDAAGVHGNRPVPVSKNGPGTWLIREAALNSNSIPWVAPYPGGYGYTTDMAVPAATNIFSTAGLRIEAGTVRYGHDNIVPTTQAIRFEGATATLDLNNHGQQISHLQSTADGNGIVDFGDGDETGFLQVTNVTRPMPAPVAGAHVRPSGYLFDDVLFDQVLGSSIGRSVVTATGALTPGITGYRYYYHTGAGDQAQITQLNNITPTGTNGILYTVGGWRGTFAGKGVLELNQPNPTAGTYTVSTPVVPGFVAGGYPLQPKGGALPFQIRLASADTVLVIRPNSHLDYYQDAIDNAIATETLNTITTGVSANNSLRTIAVSDADWTAARFNGGLLALESFGGDKTHTQAGFVQGVRVDVRQGTLRIVATTAGPANPSAFEDNIFASLNIAEGATFRLDDESAPNPNNASIAAGFRHTVTTGATAWTPRRSVWARLDELTGSGTIDLGATTPEVVLTSSPATLRTTGQNFGNAIDFNFNGIVDNYITGNGGIRIFGGREVGFTNTNNDFAGPFLINGTLEVYGDHTTGYRNYIYVASGGGIKAVSGDHVIESSVLFDKNSYIYTNVTNGNVDYIIANGGVSLAATVVPDDKVYVTAPEVNATAGDNVVVLQGNGVNTLQPRIVVTDNNGLPVLDKWEVRATANNELVLHALQDINDADNPNPPVDPVDPTNPNFTFAGDSASTTSAIGGTITLVDDAGAPVASADIAVRLFHSGGVNTGDDANAIAGPKTYTTDDAGVITYEFTPADVETLTAFEAGATYVVKASADGYSPAVRNVTIPGSAPITGSSSSGCDAGFGVFALLAATGAVTLLRKKD